LDSRFLHGDIHLIRRLKDGDIKAFELIFSKYKGKLYFFTLGYLHSATETEEIIQNLFVSLWENRHTLEEELSLRNYLYKAAINRVYNYFKHQAVKQKYFDHLAIEETLAEDHTHQHIYYNELKGTVETLIGALPFRQQMIFKLSRQEGLSHQEIADRLGLSVRSVENQIYRALRYIKEHLNEKYLLTE
jgi:RNA polymerase sigma-70 factor (ECF subfamily)